jgi:predicted phage terminase large subunit-like protein
MRAALEGTESYIVIISDTFSQAQLPLEAIKEELEFNKRIAEDYPYSAGRGPVWRQDRIRLRNGCLIEVFGTRGKIRGRKKGHQRPSLIIVDDPQNDENIESDVQRDKDQRWLDKAVLPAGNSKTNYLMIGTALHRECLVCNAERNPTWETHKFKAIIEWPRNAQYWKRWETIYNDRNNPNRLDTARNYYLANRSKMLEGSRVLWPEAEDLYALNEMIQLSGIASFNSEKQNDPRDPSKAEFSPEYFQDWIWAKSFFPREMAIRTIGYDPSKGKDSSSSRKSKRSDYQAITLYGRDLDGIEHVKQALMARCSLQEGINALLDATEYFEPHAVAIEVNLFNELLAAEFHRQCKERELDPPLYLINNNVKKAIRIRRHEAYLARREVRFFANHTPTKMLVEQLEDFPLGNHDDGPDAWEMARRAAIAIDYDLFYGHEIPAQIPGVANLDK